LLVAGLESHGAIGRDPLRPPDPLSHYDTDSYEEEEEEEEDEEEFEGWRAEEMDEVTVSSPLMLSATEARGGVSVVEMVMGALRRSLMLCSSGVGAGVREPEQEEDGVTPPGGMQIGGPTDVRHVSHVTFESSTASLASSTSPLTSSPTCLAPCRAQGQCSNTFYSPIV
jgi:hypothetical protein